MIHSKQYRSVFVFFIVVVSEANARQTPSYKTNEDGLDDLPPDFMSFVKGLDSMVFQSERKRNLTEAKYKPSTTKENKIDHRRRYSENIKASQTAAIRDILMLKLVSYYEDKYNVGQTKTFTTPQMLAPIERRRSLMRAMPMERYGRGARRRSNTLKNTENIENTNAIDQTSQDTTPAVDEVVALR